MAPPSTDAGTAIDPSSVDVLYLVNGTGADVGRISYSDSNCSSGNGWRFDSSGDIVLCDNTCLVFRMDMHPTILVVIRCN